jgi:hypothetical protein
MSRLEELLTQSVLSEGTKPSAEMVIRRLATNKPLRLFLQSITTLSTPRFQEFVADFRSLYNIAQTDVIATQDSGIMTEIMKYPHFVAFLKRITE